MVVGEETVEMAEASWKSSYETEHRSLGTENHKSSNRLSTLWYNQWHSETEFYIKGFAYEEAILPSQRGDSHKSRELAEGLVAQRGPIAERIKTTREFGDLITLNIAQLVKNKNMLSRSPSWEYSSGLESSKKP